VLSASGTGFVVNHDLPALPADRTYQLWGVVGSHTVSLGLLGSRPGIVPFSVAGAAEPTAFAVSSEHAGGAVQPSGRPVAASAVTA
jgi:anti-sigma-K factor RskA